MLGRHLHAVAISMAWMAIPECRKHGGNNQTAIANKLAGNFRSWEASGNQCLVGCLDVPYATSAAFKRIEGGQVAKSRRYSSEPHDLSAAWANRRPWRVFICLFVAHGQSGP